MNASMNGPAARLRRAGHLLDQDPPARREQSLDAGDERRVVAPADVLAHLDRRHRVEGTVSDLAVVLEPDLDPVLESLGLDPGVDEGLLLRRQGHPDDADAVLLGRVDRQRAPPAADVEVPVRRGVGQRVEPQLAADEVELVALRVLQGVRRVVAREVRAGVSHVRVEDERVEVVGEVVVVGDRVLVTPPRVQPSAQPGLARGWRRRPADHVEGEGRPDPRDQRGRRPGGP